MKRILPLLSVLLMLTGGATAALLAANDASVARHFQRAALSLVRAPRSGSFAPRASQTFTVNSNADPGTGACDAAECTLREAVAAANANAGTDTIAFDPSVTGTITLTNGELLLSDSVQIVGKGANVLAVSGNDASRIFEIADGVTATISGLTIRNGRAPLNSTADAFGGGLLNGSGTLNLSFCHVTNNKAIGGTAANGNGGFGNGGGIDNNSGGTVTIANCTLSGNIATGGNATNNLPNNTPHAGQGGGVYSGYSTLTMSNTTISGNAANGGSNVTGNGGGAEGGGLVSFSNTTTISSCTISSNTAIGGQGSSGNGQAFGGGVSSPFPAIALNSSIIAGNSVNGVSAFSPDASAGFSGSFNLIGNGTDVTGITNGTNNNQIGTSATPIDPKLGPLQDNSGPTPTRALLAGSPAIDKGTANSFTTDQRGTGFARTYDDTAITNADDGTDIGAFELQPNAGTCDTIVTTIADSGTGSLRAAIDCSNTTSGPQTVTFANNVSGTITLTTGQIVVSNEVTIQGPGQSVVTVSGNNQSRIFAVNANVSATINDLALTNGKTVSANSGSGTATDRAGGAIFKDAATNDASTLTLSNLSISNSLAQASPNGSINGTGGGVASYAPLTISNCTFSGNMATVINRAGAQGGGVYASKGAIISGSTFSTNTAGRGGGASLTGAISVSGCTFTGNTGADFGGGLYLQDSVFGSATASVVGSTFASNKVTGQGNTISGGSAIAGVFFFSTETFSIANSTFSANSTTSPGSAMGAVFNGTSPATSILTLDSCTFSGNTASAPTVAVNGVYNSSQGQGAVTKIGNTILKAGDATATIGNSTDGVVTSLGYNLASDNGGGFLTATGDQINTDPKLGPLADNGGPTQTFALLANSPAINAGSTLLATDQRGVARPQGSADDIGAFEAPPTAGTCDTIVTTNADSGTGSLRAAIDCSNTTTGVQTISFNIPGAGVHAIALTSTLPDVTDPAIIDGTTQPGSSANSNPVGQGLNAVLNVVVSGPANQAALRITGGSTVRGLVFNGAFTGVVLSGAGGNHVESCFFGTNAAGTLADSTTANKQGISILNSPNNVIGGLTPQARNLISGSTIEPNNSSSGVIINGAGATGNLVQGNLIGTNAAGTAALGNNIYGVFVVFSAANNVIGGTAAGAHNVISGNSIGVRLAQGIPATLSPHDNIVQGNFIGTDVTGNSALPNTQIGAAIEGTNNTLGGAGANAGNVVSGNSSNGVNVGNFGGTGNTIQGNLIGTKADGLGALGNGGAGVVVNFGATNSAIGGTAATARNVIAFNGGSGVSVLYNDNSISRSTGNAILGNVISSNAKLGIDLSSGFGGDDGVTPNDDGDADSGANNFQNYPVLTAASGNTITGTLNSTASTTFRIEFFANDAADSSGNGEGQTFLGFVNTTTGANGNTPTFNFTAPSNLSGKFISATATDPGGNTSEFSQTIAVQAPAQPSISINNAAPVAEGNSGQANSSTFTVTLSAASTQEVRVSYQTQSGTAIEGSDFVRTTGQLIFTPNETTKTISVPILGDLIAEGNETFTVVLSAPINATLNAQATTGTGTITDDDVAKLTLSITPTTFSEAAGATAATGTVTRNTPTTAALTVNLLSSNTSKVTVPATVIIPANQASATFALSAVDNTIVDGSKTVTITASSTGLAAATADVTVTDNDSTTPGNTPPVAQNQSVTTNQDTPKTIALGATDANNDALTFSIVTPPQNGTLSGTAANLTYTPKAGFTGTDSFAFKANDGKADSNIATVTVQVLAENKAPVAANQNLSTKVNTPLVLALTATDANNDALTFRIVSQPKNGKLSGSAARLTYTPNDGFTGTDMFTFIANDGKADSNIGTITVQVLAAPPVNQAPVAQSQNAAHETKHAAGTGAQSD